MYEVKIRYIKQTQSKLAKFKSTFDTRHDWGDEDLEVLYERWPNIKFSNIPTAWILPIDEMLGLLRYHNTITEILQCFGQLIIIHNGLTEKQLQTINATENKIKAIDIDLYETIN